MKKSLVLLGFLNGASEGIRTLDVHLGKVKSFIAKGWQIKMRF